MKTEDLINALAADTVPQSDCDTRMARWLPVGAVISAAALLAFWHLRPDLGAALSSFALYKTLVPALLSLAALWLVHSLARPEVHPTREGSVLALLLAALGAALVHGLTTTSPPQIAALLNTPDFANCLVSVPALSALPLAAGIWAMRAGAPRNPTLAGAALGLAAGGIGAAIYSLHCPHDALMYFFPAYGTAITTVVLLGALIGRRALRW